MSTSKPRIWESPAEPEDDARTLSEPIVLFAGGAERVCASVRDIEAVLSHHVRHAIGRSGAALDDPDLLRDEYERVGELLIGLEGGALAADDPELDELVFSPCAIQAEWGPVLSVLLGSPVAGTDAVFGQTQVRHGIPAAYELVAQVVGDTVARDLCLTGRTVDAVEALRIGLVSRVCEPGDVLETARALAADLAELPGAAETKRRALARQPEVFGWP